MNDESLYPRAEDTDDGRGPLAIAAGLVAAIVAGGIWAALVFVTNTEIGYVAWGVGLLVGFAMSRITARRTKSLAYAAAVLAIVGLVAGKAIIFAGSRSSIAENVESDPETMSSVMAWQMYEQRTLDGPTLAGVDALADDEPVPEALWAQMKQQANARLATLDQDEKHQLALASSNAIMNNLGFIGGVRAQLSAFDLLWLFLAVGTAYRIMAPVKEEAAPQPAATV
jgi:hypothetical protein